MKTATGNGGVPAEQPAHVPLREQAESLAAALPPLLVAAERLASAVNLGVHGRRKAGIGETFWQFRRYSREDPSTLIDWRQSAKSQHLFVREREWEAAEAVWFWRDGSASMRFRSGNRVTTKIERANLLALSLASLLVRGGERIALMGDGHAPATGRGALRRISHELVDLAPAGNALPPDAPVTKNSQLIWLSDFLSPIADIENTLRRLARTGLTGHLVHVIDPAEEEFPFAGRTRFESVTNAESQLFGRAETVRSSYCARFRAHAEAVSAMAPRLSWRYLAHRTDKRPETALIALYADIGGSDAKLRT
ncbi:MAG: DUF58 domain-containing protein [Rhizomicrobium sp.]